MFNYPWKHYPKTELECLEEEFRNMDYPYKKDFKYFIEREVWTGTHSDFIKMEVNESYYNKFFSLKKKLKR